MWLTSKTIGFCFVDRIKDHKTGQEQLKSQLIISNGHRRVPGRTQLESFKAAVSRPSPGSFNIIRFFHLDPNGQQSYFQSAKSLHWKCIALACFRTLYRTWCTPSASQTGIGPSGCCQVRIWQFSDAPEIRPYYNSVEQWSPRCYTSRK